MSEPTVLPEWRQAVRDFLAADFKDGDVVPHAWLESRFGMPPLNEDEPLLPAVWQERQFRWLAMIESFRTELLEEHNIHLSNVYGQGYRVVPAREQTAIAEEKFQRETRRSFRKTALILKHVRIEQLSDSERRENMDAIAKLSKLRGMQKALE